MPKVKMNPVFEQFHGAVGELVFRRYGDQVVASRKPDMENRVWSESQEAHRKRFREATLYGRMVLADPEAKAVYQEAAKAHGQPVFSVIIADFFNAPEIDVIDVSGYGGKSGDAIIIQAHDDMQVADVHVALATAEGAEIESGSAIEQPAKSSRWVYTATQNVATGTTVRISVSAKDRPGGKAEKEEEKKIL